MAERQASNPQYSEDWLSDSGCRLCHAGFCFPAPVYGADYVVSIRSRNHEAGLHPGKRALFHLYLISTVLASPLLSQLVNCPMTGACRAGEYIDRH